MYNTTTIENAVKSIATARSIDYVSDSIVTYEINRAIDYGTYLRNCNVEELYNETKDYSNVLTSMTLSALVLYDKMGITSSTENGITNTFENGSIYLKHDTDQFVTRLRGIR